MGENMKDSIYMTKSTDSEYTTGLMGDVTKGTGLKESSMAKESTFLLMELSKSESGRTDGDKNGSTKAGLNEKTS